MVVLAHTRMSQRTLAVRVTPNMTERVIKIVLGCSLVGLGLTGRRFGWGGLGASRREGAPSVPRWLGGGLFVIVGLWFIYMGIRGL
jgi:hypothetical protein